MSPLKHSQNLAARMGRWSAAHRKTAFFGWLAFVIVAFAIGTMTGTKQIDQNDANVGESRTADKIIDEAGFVVDEKGETVRDGRARWCSCSPRRSPSRTRRSAPPSRTRRRRSPPIPR